MNQIELLRFLQKSVSEAELKTICYHLKEDYENLPGSGKADKALGLVRHMERRKRLPCLELISRRYGRLPLGALDPSGQESAHISLGQVFINLNVHSEIKQDEASNVIWTKAALGRIYMERHFILLGDPGSGKSTLLRYLSNVNTG